MKGIHPAVWVVVGIIYVICPLDGDFVFPIGLVDDLFVAIFCIKKYCEGNGGGGAGGGGSAAAQSVTVTIPGHPRIPFQGAPVP